MRPYIHSLIRPPEHAGTKKFKLSPEAALKALEEQTVVIQLASFIILISCYANLSE